MKRILVFIACSCVCLVPLFAQESLHQKKLTLYQVVELAKEQSPSALQAETVKENRYWRYKTYLSNYKPQLVLSGREEFSREVVPTRQNDGTFAFPQVNQNYSSVALSLEQQIGFSGSRIFLSSSLNRFDNFFLGNTLYSGNPAFIGFTQPLFFYNDLRWDKKIAPLRYEESKRKYVEDMEKISVKATNLFFDMLLAQASLKIAKTNLQNNDTIYKMAQQRQLETGGSGSELLQLELSVMRSRQQVAKAELELESSTLSLKSYIGISSLESLELLPPENIPDFEISDEKALEEARKNRQAAIAFKRRKLEAARGVAWAKGSGGIDAKIHATYGLTQRGDVITDVYNEPDNQQSVMLNFSIPVMDWGRQKSREKTAEANQKLTNYTVAQDQINFEQEVVTQVRLFDMLRQQVQIAQKSDEIAYKRYELARRRYLDDEISITDLNIAMQEKDEATKSYIDSLKDFWRSFYQLRRLTLYDFEHDIRIVL